MIQFDVGTEEKIQDEVSNSQMWGMIKAHIKSIQRPRQHAEFFHVCIKSFITCQHLISQYVKRNVIRCYQVIYPRHPRDIFPHLNWNEWYGRAFRGNLSPVYSANPNANNPTHTHTQAHTHTNTALSDWHWRLSQAREGWWGVEAVGGGGADNPCPHTAPADLKGNATYHTLTCMTFIVYS